MNSNKKEAYPISVCGYVTYLIYILKVTTFYCICILLCFRYGIECLFRFYSYGLEDIFRPKIYEDFQAETIADYENG